MNIYDVTLLQHGQEFFRGYSHGSNALEAVENGFRSGELSTPPDNASFEAHVLSVQGLIFKFEIGCCR